MIGRTLQESDSRSFVTTSVLRIVVWSTQGSLVIQPFRHRHLLDLTIHSGQLLAAVVAGAVGARFG
jgi:hypothetical protein